MIFLLSTSIAFYAIVSVVFAFYLFNRMWDAFTDPVFGRITERSETLALVVVVFGTPALFVGLVIGWPVVLYRQIRKELADAD